MALPEQAFPRGGEFVPDSGTFHAKPLAELRPRERHDLSRILVDADASFVTYVPSKPGEKAIVQVAGLVPPQSFFSMVYSERINTGKRDIYGGDDDMTPIASDFATGSSQSVGKVKPGELERVIEAMADFDASLSFGGLRDEETGETMIKVAVFAAVDKTKFLEVICGKTPVIEKNEQDRIETLAEVHITEREKDVIRQLVRGGRNRDIALALGISVRSVGNFLAKIYGKLHVHRREQAVLWAYQSGLVEAE